MIRRSKEQTKINRPIYRAVNLLTQVLDVNPHKEAQAIELLKQAIREKKEILEEQSTT